MPGTVGTSATDDRIAFRRTEVARLRSEDKTIREIARELKVSVGLIHSDLAAVRQEAAKARLFDADHERHVAVARLDGALEVLYEVLDAEVYDDAGNQDHELRLKALDRLTRLEERRAKLLGLDMPTKTEVDARVTSEATPTEAARLVREAFGSHALDGADTGDTESDGAGDVSPASSGS